MISKFKASNWVEVTAGDKHLTLELRTPPVEVNPKTNLAFWGGEQSLGAFYGVVILSGNRYMQHIHPNYNFAKIYCIETIKARRTNDRIRFEWYDGVHSMSDTPYILLDNIRITCASVNKDGKVLVQDTRLSSCKESTVLLGRNNFYSGVATERLLAGAAKLLRDKTRLAREVFVHKHPIAMVSADKIIEFGRSYPLSFAQLNAIEPTCRALLRQFEMLTQEGEGEGEGDLNS